MYTTKSSLGWNFTCWGGGRWSAVYSLWTYIHRVLRILGISSVDGEEVALLSGSLVRIHCQRSRHSNSPLLLSHHTDLLHPDEPIGWINPSQTTLQQTLFYLHFDSSDNCSSDHARLATASPVDNTSRAWIAVDSKTGMLTLTVSESHAALFHVRSISSSSTALYYSCMAGQFLTVQDKTLRARVSAQTITNSETFVINHVPLPPTLNKIKDDTYPTDCTMATAFSKTRSSMVRIQSRCFDWFIASKPGTPISAAKGNDTGWDGFTLEYDSPSRLARLKDSRGLYLGLGKDLKTLIAIDDSEKKFSTSNEDYEIRKETFMIETIDEDDRVVLRSRKGYLSAQRGGTLILNQNTVPSKRETFYLRVALPSMMDQSRPRLRLRQCTGGARQVDASILVPSSAKIAYQVLQDYDGFKTFITHASESKVLQRRSATELTVMMVQCHSFLVLTIPMTLTLDVVENEEKGTIIMNLKSGLGVKEYKGKWQAIPKPDGSSIIKCSILAATSVPAPGFLMDGLVSHATVSTLEQLRIECGKRAAAEKLNNMNEKRKLRKNLSLRRKNIATQYTTSRVKLDV